MNSLSKDQYNPIFNDTRRYNPNIEDYTTTVFAQGAKTDNTLKVDGTLEVQGRDVMKELDVMRDALLLLKRDVDMESKYPELKQAYDEYRKILDEIMVMEKLTT